MIKLYYTHSTEENWFHLDSYTVEIDDEDEKKRLEKIIKDEISQSAEYPDWEHIAVRLNVDKRIIDIDVDEIEKL